jgi:hypothetical protein
LRETLSLIKKMGALLRGGVLVGGLVERKEVYARGRDDEKINPKCPK